MNIKDNMDIYQCLVSFCLNTSFIHFECTVNLRQTRLDHVSCLDCNFLREAINHKCMNMKDNMDFCIKYSVSFVCTIHTFCVDQCSAESFGVAAKKEQSSKNMLEKKG